MKILHNKHGHNKLLHHSSFSTLVVLLIFAFTCSTNTNGYMCVAQRQPQRQVRSRSFSRPPSRSQAQSQLRSPVPHGARRKVPGTGPFSGSPFRIIGASSYRQRRYEEKLRRQQDFARRKREKYEYYRQAQLQAQRRRSAPRFLDQKDWITDKRSRIYNLNSRLEPPPGRTNWTAKLILANVAMYALQVWKPSVTNWGVKLSDRILRGEQLYRLISPIFLHGGIAHLLTNMASLQNVGVNCERMFGSGRYMTTFFVAGITGNFLSALQSPNPALGASGAIFGIMGAFFVFLNRHEWLFGGSFSQSIAQTLIFNLVIGAANPMVDNWGHMGGAVGGALMAYAFGPNLYVTDLPSSDGTRSRRVVVDRPIIRLPRSIETFPETVSRPVFKVVGTALIGVLNAIDFIIGGKQRAGRTRTGAGRSDKPWKNPTTGSSTTTSSQDVPPHRRLSPGQSIKPRQLDINKQDTEDEDDGVDEDEW